MPNPPPPAALDRERALNARPQPAPVVRTERTADKLRVTVELARPRWQQWLGAQRLCQRTFSLDAYGQEVYAACDGQCTVRSIIRDFAAHHHLAPPEAEMAVTTFLKTLMAKGLVVMNVR